MIFFSPEILVTVSQCEEAVQPMILDKIALILAIIGGLNWGSIGLFQFDSSPLCSADRTALSAA